MSVATTSPLRSALARFSALDAHAWPVTAERGAPAQLAAYDVLRDDDALGSLLHDVTALYAVADRAEAATVLAAHWSWLLSLPARAAWSVGGIVPDVHPVHVAFTRDDQGVPAMALLTSDHYGCVADGPAAYADGAIVFATTRTLNAWWLGRVLDMHLEPLMTRLQKVSGATRQSLQQAVADGFAAARDAVRGTMQCRS